MVTIFLLDHRSNPLCHHGPWGRGDRSSSPVAPGCHHTLVLTDFMPGGRRFVPTCPWGVVTRWISKGRGLGRWLDGVSPRSRGDSVVTGSWRIGASRRVFCHHARQSVVTGRRPRGRAIVTTWGVVTWDQLAEDIPVTTDGRGDANPPGERLFCPHGTCSQLRTKYIGTDILSRGDGGPVSSPDVCHHAGVVTRLSAARADFAPTHRVDVAALVQIGPCHHAGVVTRQPGRAAFSVTTGGVVTRCSVHRADFAPTHRVYVAALLQIGPCHHAGVVTRQPGRAAFSVTTGGVVTAKKRPVAGFVTTGGF